MTQPSKSTDPALLPLDGDNRRLQEHVHPPDWTNPTPPEGRYNLVVLGGGTAGLVSAAGAAGLGARVALVEKGLLGGDCLNTGCVPSKALLASAHAAAVARGSADLGVHAADVQVDFPGLMERMRRLRADISHHDSAARFRDLGVDVYLGEGRFTGEDTLEVDGRRLRFARACIATGSRATRAPIPGLDEIDALTNESFFSLTELPERLAIVGGGPIGCEMAQAFARFGSRVTLIELGEKLMPHDGPDPARIVRTALERDGVDVRTQTSAKAFARAAAATKVTLERGGDAEELEVDAVLLAIGRSPTVEGVGLEAAGVAFDRRKGIEVDDRLRTSNKRIFAAGDCATRFKFTHMADALARIVLRNALFFGRAKASSLVVPWCTYTDPEVAHVGLHLDEARKKGHDATATRVELSTVDRSLLEGTPEGFLDVIHDPKGRVLGATMVAPHAGETIGELAVAVQQKLGLATLSNVIHPYPTVAEAVRKAGDAFNRTRLTPAKKKILERVLAWRR